mmetsp:Transcript_18498/g.70158  ORF Transcript_18498/g.70158 Transcript_18498/m.70158 type:complete len:237 (-) Transcript_18498:2476-3186(-)
MILPTDTPTTTPAATVRIAKCPSPRARQRHKPRPDQYCRPVHLRATSKTGLYRVTRSTSPSASRSASSRAAKASARLCNSWRESLSLGSPSAFPSAWARCLASSSSARRCSWNAWPSGSCSRSRVHRAPFDSTPVYFRIVAIPRIATSTACAIFSGSSSEAFSRNSVRMSWNSSSRLMDGNDRTRVRHSLYIPSMSPLAKRRALIVTDAMATHLVRALWLRAPCRERAALPALQDV